MNHVSYDKCVPSLRSRPGPTQADDNLDLEHIWTSVHMNNNSNAPITGHTLERFKELQRTNCNNSRPRQSLGCMQAPMARHAPAGARISCTRDARAQAPSRRVYHMRTPFEGVQASQSHFDRPLRHSNAPKCSSEDALHTDNQPRRMQQPWRMHLASPERHAPGAHKTGRMHLLAPK